MMPWLESTLKSLLLSFTLACTFCTNAADVPGKASHTKESIIVAADKDYSPYSFIAEDGRSQGYDVELIYALGERMQKNIDLRLMTWNDALKALDEGKIDALTGMTYSEKRLSKIDFSTPLTNDAYVAFGDSRKDIKIENLFGRKLCTIENDAIKEAFIIPYNLEKNTSFFPTYSECFKSVAAGINDFAIAPYLTGKKLTTAFDINHIDATGPVLNNSIYCIGVKKGNPLLRDINRAIIDLSASDQLDSIKRKWLIDYVEKISLRAFLKNNTGYLLAVILCIALLSYYVNEKINQKKRERTFLTDPVTGGGNFNRFVSECETLFAENSKPFHYTIVAFNIRNFKMFNENFGYEAGDALLCAIANIAQPVFSPRSFARISADNFVMLILSC